MYSQKPLFLLPEINKSTTTTRPQLGTKIRETLGEECKPPTFALATKRFRAIDLSCRACDACGAGAGCWAWIPGGGPHASVFTPNLRCFLRSNVPLILFTSMCPEVGLDFYFLGVQRSDCVWGVRRSDGDLHFRVSRGRNGIFTLGVRRSD